MCVLSLSATGSGAVMDLKLKSKYGSSAGDQELEQEFSAFLWNLFQELGLHKYPHLWGLDRLSHLTALLGCKSISEILAFGFGCLVDKRPASSLNNSIKLQKCKLVNLPDKKRNVKLDDRALYILMFLSCFCSFELCWRIQTLWTPFRFGFHEIWHSKLLRTDLFYCTGSNYCTSLCKTQKEIWNEGVFQLRNMSLL